jgi:hypothetical protein
MKASVLFLITFSMVCLCSADSLKVIIPKTYSKFMKTAIEAKDAPAACWYLGIAQGYLRALADAGNAKASKFASETKNAEGKCGGKNSLDLKNTFTVEEWTKLSALQQKIESAEL